MTDIITPEVKEALKCLERGVCRFGHNGQCEHEVILCIEFRELADMVKENARQSLHFESLYQMECDKTLSCEKEIESLKKKLDRMKA